MSDFKLKAKIDGQDNIINKLNKLKENINDGSNKALEQIIEKMKQFTIDEAPKNTGILSNNIHSIVENGENNEFIYKIYLDSAEIPWLMYVYHGTGNSSDGVKPSKGKGMWFVPVTTASQTSSSGDLTKYYGDPVTYNFGGKDNKNEVLGWQVWGQKPNKFIDRALKRTKEVSLNIFKETIDTYVMKGL